MCECVCVFVSVLVCVHKLIFYVFVLYVCVCFPVFVYESMFGLLGHSQYDLITRDGLHRQ